jgi:hypothetical protein
MVAGLSPFEKPLVCVPCPRHDVSCWDKLLVVCQHDVAKKKNIYIFWEVVAGWSFLRYVSSLMHFTWIISSLCMDELFLHMVENTNLTYAKVSCSLVLIDSFFSSCNEKCALSTTLL